VSAPDAVSRAPRSPRPVQGPVEDRPLHRLRVALAASGPVGGALIRALRDRRGMGAGPADVSLDLACVLGLDRAGVETSLDASLIAADIEAFLAAPADVVIEAVPDPELARELASRALAAGRRYVSASTSLVVEHGPDLAALAVEAETTFDFSAALPGCMPVARLLRDRVAPDSIHAIRLLDRLRDPSAHTAADRIAILAWLAFGADPRRLSVRRVTLAPGAFDLGAVTGAVGGLTRQLAEAVRLPDGVIASVEPIVLDPTSRFAAVADRAVLVDTNARASSFQGGGGNEDAVVSALLSDLVSPGGPLRPVSSETLSFLPDPRTHLWLMPVPQRVLRYLWRSCKKHDAKGSVMVPAVDLDGDTLVCLRGLRAAVESIAADLSRADAKVGWVRWER
jgi:homoserine dehydrogenase